jgi:hypothetical protein
VTRSRRRAEVLAELASGRRWLAEVRAGAIRRAGDLARLRELCKSGRARAALQATARDVLLVGEQAEAALVNIEGDLSELVADEPDGNGGERVA